jgi:glutaredoxin-like protein NrdH
MEVQNNVVVYSKPNCQQCEMTKTYLSNKGVDYIVVDISKDQDAFSRISQLGYRQVPVVESGEEHWSGFQPAKLNAILN